MAFFVTSGESSLDAGRAPLAPPTWQRALAEAIRDPDELIDLVDLPDTFRDAARRAARLFPLVVPHSFVARMRRGDPADPLLRQVLPLDVEEVDEAGFTFDPVGDAAARRAPGLLQKYRGRALLIATGACAVHCRYCFRRHYPYGEEPRRLDDWEPALTAIADDPSLHEVILSGGDPLMLTDARLSALVVRIAAIPHVARLRIHTRLPIVLPERVTDALLSLLSNISQSRDAAGADAERDVPGTEYSGLSTVEAGSNAQRNAKRTECSVLSTPVIEPTHASGRLTPIVVVHANHPYELTGTCADALRKLVRSGITTLNQAVLLRGVNDSVEALTGLSERLVDLGVIPYYLHQLDRVAGAAHFEVPKATGLSLISELKRLLPGYAVPKYVRETPGGVSKEDIV